MEIVPFEEMDKLKADIPDMLDLWVKQMAETTGKEAEAKEVADYIRENR